MARDFLDHNFLSDDKRYPVTEIGTNIARAAASNATKGHIWDNFSSETYKELPSVGVIRGLYNPIKPSESIHFTLGGGGRGYYRVPSLISIWATAPFLHNNSLGTFLKDPSVGGRMACYEDAMEKLLWPERRLGVQSVLVTTTPSKITGRDGSELQVPAGMPIKLIANLDPNELPLRGPSSNWLTRMFSKLFGGKLLWESLLEKNLAPDFIEDRGHNYASNLPDSDKRALIELMKSF